MALNFNRQVNGLQLVPQNTILPDTLGEIRYNSSTNKLELFNGSLDPVVTESDSATLTNKIISGNTATNLVNGAGTIDFNSSGTITVPNATDTLVGRNTTDTLTNKTIDAGSNTITGLSSANFAPIADSTIESNISGASAAPSANTLTSIFDHVLSNVQGSIIYRNASSWVTLPPGTATNVLTTGGAGANPSWLPNAIGSFADIHLDNLSSTAINTDLNPNSDGVFSLGTTNRWDVIQGVKVNGGLLQAGIFLENLTAGSSYPANFSGNSLSSANASGGMSIQTINDSAVNPMATGQIEIFTGNKTAGTGNSGNIGLNIGTSSGGSRGKIAFKDGSEGTSGQIWTSTDTVGSGHWAAFTVPSGSITTTQISATAGILPSQNDSITSGNYVALSSSSSSFSTASSTDVNVTNLTNIGPTLLVTTRPVFINFINGEVGMTFNGNTVAKIVFSIKRTNGATVGGTVATFTFNKDFTTSNNGEVLAIPCGCLNCIDTAPTASFPTYNLTARVTNIAGGAADGNVTNVQMQVLQV